MTPHKLRPKPNALSVCSLARRISESVMLTSNSRNLGLPLLLVFALCFTNCLGQKVDRPEERQSAATKPESVHGMDAIRDGRSEFDGKDGERRAARSNTLREGGEMTPSQRASGERLYKVMHPEPVDHSSSAHLKSVGSAKFVLLDLTSNSNTKEAILKDRPLTAIQLYLAEHSQSGMKKLLAKNRGQIVFIIGHNEHGKFIATDSSDRRVGTSIDLHRMDADAQEVGAYPIVLSCFAACYVRAGPIKEVSSLDIVGMVSRMRDSLVDGTFLLDGTVPPQSLFFPDDKSRRFRISSGYDEQILQRTSYVITDRNTGRKLITVRIPTCVSDDGTCEKIRRVTAHYAALEANRPNSYYEGKR